MQGDEFQAEVFGGGGWWNYPSRSLLFGSSPCGSGIISEFGGGFGYWSSSSPHELLDMMKTRSCGDGDGDDEYYSGGGGGGGSAASDGSVVIHKPNQNQPDSASGGLSMDSGSLKIMGNIGISSSSSSSSSSTTDWINNPANFLQNGSNGTILEQQHRNSSMNNYGQSDGGGGEIQKDMMSWVDNLNNFSTLIPHNDDHQDFPLNSSSSSSYGINYSSTTTYNSPPPPHDQPQTQSLFGNYQRNLNQFLPNSNLANKFSPLTNSSSSSSLPPAAVLNDFRPTNLFATTQSHLLSSTFNDKTYTTTLTNLSTAKGSNEEVTLGNLGSVAKKNSSSELPAFKRPRIETPSPLPTFKVRKEKLGDRITALQQLVSPFGKTDTASVLHEAIEYIKFLHDQVNVLSTPYMRNGSPIQRQQSGDIKKRDQQGGKQDLRSRGLCLVPISSTFPVAAETTTDFWTPTFGATFR